MEVTKYRYQNIAVYGLGRTGTSSVYALQNGGAKVIAWDDREEIRIKWLENLDPQHLIHLPESILCDLSNDAWHNVNKIIITPGTKLNDKIKYIIDNSGCQVTSDIELLWETCKDAKYIGITGTNGKSTTTSLIGHILNTAKLRCQIGGNIGIPVLDLEPLCGGGIYVLELSSYQLDLIDQTCFDIAILLNLTEDHLEYHNSYDNYITAKLKIFKNKNNIAIISVDSNLTKKIYDKIVTTQNSKIIAISTMIVEKNTITVKNDIIYDYLDDHLITYNYSNSLNLAGEHNWQNIAAAFAACRDIVSPLIIIEAINSFKGLPHRIEYIGKKNNVTFINDSKATNSDSTAKALNLFDNIYWLAGGVAKESGIEKLKPYFNKIKHAFLIGKAQDEFFQVLDGVVLCTKSANLKNAFEQAIKFSESTKEYITILLSPACASFDQFKNYEHRGDIFKKLVEKYISS